MSSNTKIPAFGNTRNVMCNGHPNKLHLGSRDMRIVLILSLIHFISCSELIKEPTGIFYVLNNEPGLSIQINGQPHTALKFHKPGLDHFEPSYRSYITGQDFKIVILKESKRVFEGTYSPEPTSLTLLRISGSPYKRSHTVGNSGLIGLIFPLRVLEFISSVLITTMQPLDSSRMHHNRSLPDVAG
jgi:hypothetical protein